MNNYDFGTFILTAIAIVLSLTVHEYSHALISTAQGDETPKYYNRLTINPFSHVDLLGLLSLFLFKFGWAKPVPINPSNYKNQRLGTILTSLAGPVSNLLLSFLAAIIYFKFQPESYAVIYFLKDLILINVGFAVFNMLPFPPLDGSKIFAELFRGKIADLIYSIEGKGIFILFLLLMFPPFENFIARLIEFVFNGVIVIAIQLVSR